MNKNKMNKNKIYYTVSQDLLITLNNDLEIPISNEMKFYNLNTLMAFIHNNVDNYNNDSVICGFKKFSDYIITEHNGRKKIHFECY